MGPISHPRLQDGAAAATTTTTKGASVRGAAKKLVLFVIWSAGGAAGLGSRHSGSSLSPSLPRTLLAEMTSAMGRKKEGEGTAEREKTEGSRGIERRREDEGGKAFFLSPAIPLSVGRGRCAFRSARYIAFLPSRNVRSSPSCPAVVDRRRCQWKIFISLGLSD